MAAPSPQAAPLRLVSYNIQYSLGADGRYDLARSLSAVRQADIICLQEVERHWQRTGMVDQPALIERMMPDHFCVYGGQFDADASYRDASGRVVNRRRQTGQMTLSRWPIQAARTHVFPKLDSGNRLSLVTGALETVIAAPAGPLRLFNLHLSDTAQNERLLQIRHLMGLLRRTPSEGSIWTGSDPDAAHWQTDQPPPPMPHAALLLGDFNAAPTSPEYALLTQGSLATNGDALALSPGTFRFADSWTASGHHLMDGVTYRAQASRETQVAAMPIGTMPIGTMHVGTDQRLDYCFLPEPLVPRLRTCWIDDATTASDHQPLWVELA